MTKWQREAFACLDAMGVAYRARIRARTRARLIKTRNSRQKLGQSVH